MNGHIGPLDFTAMGREYLAHADTIGGKVAQLRREYRESHDKMLKEQMENWREIEASLRHQGLDFLRRGERRKNQMEVL